MFMETLKIAIHIQRGRTIHNVLVLAVALACHFPFFFFRSTSPFGD
jgi:hypothetical protein